MLNVTGRLLRPVLVGGFRPEFCESKKKRPVVTFCRKFFFLRLRALSVNVQSCLEWQRSREEAGAVMSKTILVVEDDPTGRKAIVDFLTSLGYQVEVATNGVDALEAYDRVRPDLALVDVLLPRKSGFEVCFEIKRKSHGRETPVLLMSAVRCDTFDVKYASADLRAQGYLMKPFRMSSLAMQVRELLS